MSGTPRPLSARQRAILEALDRHVLVSAGAGTGKTFTVVRALLYRLGLAVDDLRHHTPLALDDVAAITFTKAAAADLVADLRTALADAGARDLAMRVDVARVGTIHGFCGDLLRSFGLRGHRRVAGGIAEEAEARDLLEQAAADTLLAAIQAEDHATRSLVARFAIDAVRAWIVELATDGGRLETLLGVVSPDDADARALLALAERARARMDELLAEVPAVDFDRLLVWTRDLLRDPAVCAAVRRRLRLLVVDEFQDVDPIQREIVFLLGAPGAGDPDATRLLLVGDPKQSIYRFRRADVAVWRDTERIFREAARDCAIRPLDESYRSVPGILAFVDHTLAPAMGTDADEAARAPYEVPYAPLRPTKPRAHEPAVEVMGLRLPAGRVRDAHLRAVEARAVADRLRALHGTRLDDEPRPLAWSGMAILLASWSAVGVYADACRAADIPVYVLRTGGFLGLREVTDCLLALRAVRDPHDAVAMAGFLRSPMVGLRDESLLSLAQGGGLGSRRPLFALDADDAARLDAAHALLARFAPLRDRIPTHELLERVLDATGYRGHLALRDDDAAAQALANVALLGRLLEADGVTSVGAWLRRLRELRDSGADMAPARLYGAQEDVVTITSVHGAKGLDWDVVAWVDLLHRPRAEQGVRGLYVARDGLALKDPDLELKEQPVVQGIKDALERERDAERLRLRYVAATRPKRRLIVSGIPLGKAPKGTDAAWLAETLDLSEDTPDGTRAVTADDGSSHAVSFTGVVVPPMDGASGDGEDGEADDASGDGGWVAPRDETALVATPEALPTRQARDAVRMGRLRHSATALMLHDRCPRRYAWKYLLGLPEPEVRPDAEAATDAGTAGLDARTRGTLVHELVARADESRELGDVLDDVLREWDEDADAPGLVLSVDDREDLQAKARALQAGRYGELAAHPAARRELRFLRVLPDGSALEGALDLVAPEGDAITIADVKTSRIEPGDEAAVAARYDRQRDAYAAAVSAIAGRSVARFDFVFSETGGVVASAPAAGGERALVEAIAALEACDPTTASLARDARDCARCGYRAVGWCAGAGADATPDEAAS